MKLFPKKCPCGCKKVILEPFCGCQCSSVPAQEAHDLMVRLNAFDELRRLLTLLVGTAGKDAQLRSKAGDFLMDLAEQLEAEPSFK